MSFSLLVDWGWMEDGRNMCLACQCLEAGQGHEPGVSPFNRQKFMEFPFLVLELAPPSFMPLCLPFSREYTALIWWVIAAWGRSGESGGLPYCAAAFHSVHVTPAMSHPGPWGSASRLPGRLYGATQFAPLCESSLSEGTLLGQVKFLHLHSIS